MINNEIKKRLGPTQKIKWQEKQQDERFDGSVCVTA